jgi:hypothetical protein
MQQCPLDRPRWLSDGTEEEAGAGAQCRSWVEGCVSGLAELPSSSLGVTRLERCTQIMRAALLGHRGVVNRGDGGALSDEAAADAEAAERIAPLLGAEFGDLDAVCPRKNHSLLMMAARLGMPRCVKALLGAGARLDVQCAKDGSTALHLAAWHGCAAVVGALLRHGACCTTRNRYGETALDSAMKAQQQQQQQQHATADAAKGASANAHASVVALLQNHNAHGSIQWQQHAAADAAAGPEAQAATPQALASDWASAVDEASGRTFWFSRALGVTSWEDPRSGAAAAGSAPAASGASVGGDAAAGKAGAAAETVATDAATPDVAAASAAGGDAVQGGLLCLCPASGCCRVPAALAAAPIALDPTALHGRGGGSGGCRGAAAVGVLRLGRSSSNEIALPSLRVSKEHAVIAFFDGHGACVKDVGSTHGTSLNGERLSTAKEPSQFRALKQGDTLVLGADATATFTVDAWVAASSTRAGVLPTQQQPSHKSAPAAAAAAGATISRRFALNPQLLENARRLGGAAKRPRADPPLREPAAVRQRLASTAAPAPAPAPPADTLADGRRMLEKMGWKEGEGLGARGGGVKAAVVAVGCTGRAGLGSAPQLTAPAIAARAAARAGGGSGDKWSKARSRFHALS